LRGTCFKKTIAAAALTAATTAFGANVDASLTGLLQGRPAILAGEAQTTVPFLAQVGLNASDITMGPVQDVRVGVGAWGRVSLNGGEQSAGDVDLAYVSGKLFDKHLTVTLGRQFRSGGALRALHLDGGNLDVMLPGRLGFSIFGGVPVIPRFAAAKGDAAWGARLFWRPTFNTEIGASYFELLDHGYTGRRDLGLDARAELFRRLRVSGMAVMSAIEGRLAEGDITPALRLNQDFELTAFFRHTSPDLLLPRTSILSVFAQTNQNQGGLGLIWAPAGMISAAIDGRLISIPNDPLGYELLGQATLRPSRNTRATIEAVRLSLPDNGYTRLRLAGGATVGTLALSLDLEGYLLDLPVNGTRQSLTASATARLPLPLGFDAVVSGLVASDPFYQTRFEVIGRLVYTFKIRTRTEAPEPPKKKKDDDEKESDARRGRAAEGTT
jgi:hypothetical protein